MSSRFLFLFTVLFVSLNMADAVFAQDTLTVMTYNIYHGEQAYTKGESNLRDVAALINRVNPDLVALQEVDSLTGRSAALNNGTPVNQVQKLGALTGMHDYFGKAMDFDGGGYGEGILSRQPLEHKKVMLPTPQGGEPRALLIVEYPVKTQEKLIFGGTHLCHQYGKTRMAQMKKINRYFSSVEDPAIVAGDFNFSPKDKPYKLLGQHWMDAARLAGETIPTISYDDPSKRIDYIFLSKNSWQILNMEVLKESSSDHMPVVVKLVLE